MPAFGCTEGHFQNSSRAADQTTESKIRATPTDSVVVHHTNHSDQAICEYLRVGRVGANAGLFVQGSANRLDQAA